MQKKFKNVTKSPMFSSPALPSIYSRLIRPNRSKWPTRPTRPTRQRHTRLKIHTRPTRPKRPNRHTRLDPQDQDHQTLQTVVTGYLPGKDTALDAEILPCGLCRLLVAERTWPFGGWGQLILLEGGDDNLEDLKEMSTWRIWWKRRWGTWRSRWFHLWHRRVYW